MQVATAGRLRCSTFTPLMVSRLSHRAYLSLPQTRPSLPREVDDGSISHLGGGLRFGLSSFGTPSARSCLLATPYTGVATSFTEALQSDVAKALGPLPRLHIQGADAAARELILPSAVAPIAVEPAQQAPRLMPSGTVVSTDMEDPSGEDGAVAPIWCNQHWYRIIKNQKNAIRDVENASKADCGPRGIHWKWYRDKAIKRRKKRRTI